MRVSGKDEACCQPPMAIHRPACSLMAVFNTILLPWALLITHYPFPDPITLLFAHKHIQASHFPFFMSSINTSRLYFFLLYFFVINTTLWMDIHIATVTRLDKVKWNYRVIQEGEVIPGNLKNYVHFHSVESQFKLSFKHGGYILIRYPIRSFFS